MRNVLVIYRRELKGYFSTPIAYIFLPIFIGVLCFFFFKYPPPFFAVGRAEMRRFFALMPVALFIFAPAMTMRLWSEELRVGTAEVLLTLPFRVWELVTGKFLAAYTVLALSLALTFGIPITLGWVANPDWGPIIGGYVGSLLLGAVFVSLGSFVSSLTQNQVVALLTGLFGGVVLTMVFSPEFAAYVAGTGSWMGSAIKDLGTSSHFESVERGVLALNDIVYFLSGTILFLALNIFSVEARRY